MKTALSVLWVGEPHSLVGGWRPPLAGQTRIEGGVSATQWRTSLYSVRMGLVPRQLDRDAWGFCLDQLPARCSGYNTDFRSPRSPRVAWPGAALLDFPVQLLDLPVCGQGCLILYRRLRQPNERHPVCSPRFPGYWFFRVGYGYSGQMKPGPGFVERQVKPVSLKKGSPTLPPDPVTGIVPHNASGVSRCRHPRATADVLTLDQLPRKAVHFRHAEIPYPPSYPDGTRWYP